MTARRCPRCSLQSVTVIGFVDPAFNRQESAGTLGKGERNECGGIGSNGVRFGRVAVGERRRSLIHGVSEPLIESVELGPDFRVTHEARRFLLTG